MSLIGALHCQSPPASQPVCIPHSKPKKGLMLHLLARLEPLIFKTLSVNLRTFLTSAVRTKQVVYEPALSPLIPPTDRSKVFLLKYPAVDWLTVMMMMVVAAAVRARVVGQDDVCQDSKSIYHCWRKINWHEVTSSLQFCSPMLFVYPLNSWHELVLFSTFFSPALLSMGDDFFGDRKHKYLPKKEKMPLSLAW